MSSPCAAATIQSLIQITINVAAAVSVNDLCNVAELIRYGTGLVHLLMTQLTNQVFIQVCSQVLTQNLLIIDKISEGVATVEDIAKYYQFIIDSFEQALQG